VPESMSVMRLTSGHIVEGRLWHSEAGTDSIALLVLFQYSSKCILICGHMPNKTFDKLFAHIFISSQCLSLRPRKLLALFFSGVIACPDTFHP
jgi:hypothetical protein